MWYWLAEPPLYLCFAIITGWLLLVRFVPSIAIPRKVLLLSAIGISVLAFFPVLRIVMFFAEDIGFGLTFRNVMMQFTEGKAYLWTLLFGVLLILIICFGEPEKNDKAWISSVILITALMAAQGWSSHVASLYEWIGFASHTLHFYAVSVWAGTLLVAGWFLPSSRWASFLSWFHPMAILSMSVIFASGFILTVSVAPEYVQSWMLPYGQALLIKHLLIIPLLCFAFFNGWWMKRKIANDRTFEPRGWAKTEGALVLLIYSVTGFMNQQAAPHDVSETLRENPVSPVFRFLYPGNFEPAHMLQFTIQPMSWLFLAFALLSLLLMVQSFRRHTEFGAFLSGILFVIAAFAAALISVS